MAVDDDDLVKPELAQLTELLDEGKLALLPRATLEVTAEGRLRWNRAPSVVILSVNSAVRKSFLQMHCNMDEAQIFLSDHKRANELVADAVGPEEARRTGSGFRHIYPHDSIAYVRKVFSIKITHPGAISFLIEATKKPDPRRSLQQTDLQVPRPFPEYVESVGREVRALEQLWQRLL